MLSETSADRDVIVQRLIVDLQGPREVDEILSARPTDTYLTGILWPQRTGMSGEDDDNLAIGSSSGADDGEASEAAAVPYSSVQKPSAAGISFAFRAQGEPSLKVECSFARYTGVLDEGTRRSRWQRAQILCVLEDIDFSDGSRTVFLGTRDPAAEGVQLHIRCTDGGDRKLVTVTMINAVEAVSYTHLTLPTKA